MEMQSERKGRRKSLQEIKKKYNERRGEHDGKGRERRVEEEERRGQGAKRRTRKRSEK